MSVLDCALLSEGPSDAVLIPMLKWLLGVHLANTPARIEWADLWRCPHRPQSLSERIAATMDLYACDVLFVHRDADRDRPGRRCAEIREAVAVLPDACNQLPHICVVPVRTTEAWLLVEEMAIRRASGNPNGTVPLQLPDIHRVESIADPKAVLRDLLTTASGMRGRHLKRFNSGHCARRIADYMEDFSQLRALPAFRRLETDVQELARRV